MNKLHMTAALVGLITSALMSTLNAAEIPLLAGKNWDVGFVSITNDETNLYVSYHLDMDDPDLEGWCIKETHVEVGVTYEDFPTNKGGNPKIGHFSYSSGYDCATETVPYVIPIPDGVNVGDVLLVAAHASLEKEVCEEVYNDDLEEMETVCTVYMESAWGEGMRFNERGNWAMYMSYTILPCTLTLNVASVNGNSSFKHDFSFEIVDGVVVDATGYSVYHSFYEVIGDINYDPDTGTIAFSAKYPNNYMWYPAFNLLEDGTLEFIDVNGPDNVNAATGTWSLSCGD